MGTLKLKSSDEIFQLRISLLGSEPEIWRTIQISADASLSRLHKAIQSAFDWEDSHLHEFTTIKHEKINKKRTAEDHQKYQLGGAVLKAYQKISKEIPEDKTKVTNSIVNNHNFWKKVSKTNIYRAISTKESSYFDDIELFIKVIEGLTIYNYEGQKIFEYEILKQKNVAKK